MAMYKVSYIDVPCEGCGTVIRTASRRRKWCRECWLSRNREKVRAWVAADPDRARTLTKKNREKNRDRIAAQNAARRTRDAEKRRQAAKEYYWRNRERVLARLNTDEGRRQARERMRRKMLDDQFRLHSNISRAIRASIRDKRRRSWEQLVGYTLDELRSHLERQFHHRMTWQNMGRGKGRWNIDHIVPRIAFSYTSADDPEFRACWALTNLRPLWAEANIRKHANRTHLL